MRERESINDLIKERERAYIRASKASKASSKLVVKLVKMTNIPAKVSSTRSLRPHTLVAEGLKPSAASERHAECVCV